MWKPPSRGRLLLPVAGVALGALAGTNPFYRPQIPLESALAIWSIDLVLVLLFSLHSATLPAGVLVGGLLMGVPCFLDGSAMTRFLLMCCAAFPFALATMQLSATRTASFRDRMFYAFSWLGTREVERTQRRTDAKSILHLVLSTIVLATAIGAVKATPSAGYWWVIRWLAGGIMILAFAEMATASHRLLAGWIGLRAPALMESPVLSTTVGEFWTERWNPAAALGFRRYFFAPLARYGAGIALFTTFLASGVAHMLLPYMATGQWGISILCGAFFLVQPLFIIAERRMEVRKWWPGAGRAWTLSALTVVSPLFVEPALQVIEPSWGAPDNILQPTLVVLGGMMSVTAVYLLGSLLSVPDSCSHK